MASKSRKNDDKSHRAPVIAGIITLVCTIIAAIVGPLVVNHFSHGNKSGTNVNTVTGSGDQINMNAIGPGSSNLSLSGNTSANINQTGMPNLLNSSSGVTRSDSSPDTKGNTK
jgi:hypothetical protein